jgi:aminopeptidase N
MRKARTVVLVVGIGLIAGFAAYFLLNRRTEHPPALGIAASLAESRAARVTALRYNVTFRVPRSKTDPVSAHLRATFVLKEKRTPLLFDFAQPTERLQAMHANGNIIEPRVVNQHIEIPTSALLAGENVVEFEFLAGEAALNRNDEFLYALFVPARASQTMPVFDQPDLKAKWQLTLNIPTDWIGVSNGKEIGRVTAPTHLGLIFEETQPISTYLFTFAAGKFTIDSDERNGRIFRMLHRETDKAKLERNRKEIYDLHAKALSWLEEYTGIPYPFGKFDFVLIPSFQFGGMEHPGSVFYNASSMLLDESATQNQYLGRASLISHETSHMWFGDLVTMKWFNDVWMKEVFANFMAAKIVNPSFPEVNHELRFLLQHYPSAYDVDRTEGANPIRQDLANLNEAGSLYGAIIYQKAPIVMRQLELLVGPDKFRDGLREYLNAHKYGNATWTDLITLLDARTDTDLAAWSRAWVEERGRPRVAMTISSGGGANTMALTESDPLERRLHWPQRLFVTEGYRDRTVDVEMDFPGGTIRSEAKGREPLLWALPNGRGLGYADFVLEESNLTAIAAALPDIEAPIARGAAVVTLWESMLEGRFPPDKLMQVLLAALPRESDELNVAEMLDCVQSLYWRYTAADDRAALAPGIEKVLRNGVYQSPSTSLKAAWFGALRGVATTPETLAWLTKLWKRDEVLAKLPMSETDEADLALNLAVRDVPDAATILTTQLERFKNPDRKARFAFVMPAVSADPAVRDQFFASLKDVKNRGREAWVLEGLRYLHHPLRAATSKKFVPEALALVREIQETGDIFFPKRWADATLAGYQSPQTAAQVREFIAALPPDYPPRLKWVLLSAADPLFRATKILFK